MQSTVAVDWVWIDLSEKKRMFVLLHQVVSALNAPASEQVRGNRSCECVNCLEPWQSAARGVTGARTTYYAMGLHKAGTSLMGAALAARLGGGYEVEAIYHCKPLRSVHRVGLSSDAYPTAPHFFMDSFDAYFCQCGHKMVRLSFLLSTCTECRAQTHYLARVHLTDVGCRT